MFDFVVLIKNFWSALIALFDKYPFTIAGYEVSYFTLIFGFLVLAFTISYFWKGAKG